VGTGAGVEVGAGAEADTGAGAEADTGAGSLLLFSEFPDYRLYARGARLGARVGVAEERRSV
jgi:hypothetical protein